jgi:hypothetical protein
MSKALCFNVPDFGCLDVAIRSTHFSSVHKVPGLLVVGNIRESRENIPKCLGCEPKTGHVMIA